MARLVRFRVIDGIAVVSLDSPPVNALSRPMRAGLWDVFGRIAAQPEIRAAILRSEGRMFSAGADIREFASQAGDQPGLGDLLDRIEGCPKPVIAVLHGQALGGGAELAMAAHYRLADPRAQIGLPEVSLGLSPGAGGTQRLPRLVGVAHALAMLVTGQSIDAPAALRAGLVDGIVQGDLDTGALTYARDLLSKGKGPRPTRERRDNFGDARTYLSQLRKARHDLDGSPLFAPHLIVDAVEASTLLPFEAGLAFEEDVFARCLRHPQSVALRHVFMAERRAGETLLRREDGSFKPTDPEGRAVVFRLRRAMRGAAQAMGDSDGLSEAEIDGALVRFGFRKGPFGNREEGPENRDLIRRVVAALVVEGASIIEAGEVARPSDIDALAVHGLGFPRREGGPMRAAQTLGLLGLRNDMRDWAEENLIWEPPEILDQAVKDAAGFDRFNQA